MALSPPDLGLGHNHHRQSSYFALCGAGWRGPPSLGPSWAGTPSLCVRPSPLHPTIQLADPSAPCVCVCVCLCTRVSACICRCACDCVVEQHLLLKNTHSDFSASLSPSPFCLNPHGSVRYASLASLPQENATREKLSDCPWSPLRSQPCPTGPDSQGQAETPHCRPLLAAPKENTPC